MLYFPEKLSTPIQRRYVCTSILLLARIVLINETLYTVDYKADGQQYKFETLHVEDLFDVLVFKGADAVSGSTPLEFVKNSD